MYRFNPEGKHKEYKEDPKRKHDGTIEFTSRDAHNGVGKMWYNCVESGQSQLSSFNHTSLGA